MITKPKYGKPRPIVGYFMGEKPIEGPVIASNTSSTTLYSCSNCNNVLLYRPGLCSVCLEEFRRKHRE